MKNKALLTLLVFGLMGAGILRSEVLEKKLSERDGLLSEVRQLTFEGKRAGEGYYSADGTKMVFQSEREEGNPFYQIYLMDLETGDIERVSPGMGKTTCAWIHPGGEKVLFASTHGDGDGESSAKQEAELEERKSNRVKKYSWDYDEDYEIYVQDLATGAYTNLTNVRGYDAEGAYSPSGERVVFASNRHAYTEALSEEDAEQFALMKSHLMDIYTMAADGSDVRRLTEVDGYDGGPFYSADGERICWRRFNEKGDMAEIWSMAADGSDQRQLTKLGAMSWAPFFHPSGEYLIFATNLHGFDNFELYLVDARGEGEPVRVTDAEGFDGLPCFAPSGNELSWTSNPTAGKQSQIFVGKWNHEKALALLGASGAEAPKAEGSGRPDITVLDGAVAEADMRLHVEYLASEALDGRLTGTAGEIEATAYAAEVFAHLGLLPAGDDGTYFHEFEFTAGVALGDGNEIKVTGIEAREDLAAQWRPLSFSETGGIDPAEVVFAGYGIEVPEGDEAGTGTAAEAYDSYVHLDVEDKWVLLFRYLPEGLEAEEKRRFGRYSSLRYKALTARKKGARGIIVVSGPNSKVTDPLVPLAYDASMASSGVAAISITDDLAQQLLEGTGKELKALQDYLDTGEMMAGFALDGVKVGAQIVIDQERRTGRNVIARLASGNPDAPAVVVGAHIDHLGSKAGSNSRAGEEERDLLHPGADDNASGVAGMFEIADYLAEASREGKITLQRDVYFGAWSGEEIGLLGVSDYLSDLAEAEKGDREAKLGDRFAANLNLDMIGRLEKNLVLQGVGSSSVWKGEIERRNAVVGLPILTQDDSYLPTDATQFYLRGIPVLNAFTGAHEDYHRPTDTPDKIKYAEATRIAQLMGLIARGLATSESAPDYVETEKPENQGSRGFRVYLGTIPDYAQGDIVGVKLSGVGKLSPAQKAGVTGGDVIIRLAGQEIKNIYDFTYVMGELEVGEETTITVKRGEEEVEMKITPGSRE